MSHSVPKEDEDAPPGIPPPSYEEALSSPPVMPGRPVTQHAPPQQPPRPHPFPALSNQPASHPTQPTLQTPISGSSTGKSQLYSNNASLPFEYPRGHLCSKCKNTGFKEKNGKPCSVCWPKFGKKVSYNPNPELNFTYPKGFICDRCRNTGIKLKNGLTCKDCYARFAPRNNASQAPITYSQSSSYNSFHPSNGYSNSSFGPGPAGYGPPGVPQYVQPGDPRMGGALCGRCRGSGRVQFFLDQELCSICGGVGRLFNGQQPGFRRM